MAAKFVAIALVPLLSLGFMYSLVRILGFERAALILVALAITAVLTLLRILSIRPDRSIKPVAHGEPVHFLAVFGSGGHTSEMMSLLRNFDVTRYTQRTYIYSSGDEFSREKARLVEQKLQSKCRPGFKQTLETKDLKDDSDEARLPEPSPAGRVDPITGCWTAECVSRARKIHQPIYTAPWSSLLCFIDCIRVLIKSKSNKPLQTYPDVILINGPATAVILVFASYFLKFFGLAPREKMKIIYMESFARVRTLSLSGKILLRLHLCDQFLVQWEILRDLLRQQGYNADWRGFLVD
ncbi:hypothetical protein BP5796_02660 [Coleophoma crateriformis]|uniref:UDP-N-acetylglucosamine transferase subunit ALG14 n=1 Tax=Coleophoma crateriformis TaxID=565419 RepID=A0A3D8SYV6_9HELO|nr:hypothetical protein BP5796_02660 [Coleophoma crateriformis]